MDALVAGNSEPAEALAAALSELGVTARFQAADELAGALVGIEQELEANRPDAAVAVGTGEAALALAITASKLGVPLAAAPGTAAEGERADEGRILATLSDLDAGPDPARAADLIAAWLQRDQTPADLD